MDIQAIVAAIAGLTAVTEAKATVTQASVGLRVILPFTEEGIVGAGCVLVSTKKEGFELARLQHQAVGRVGSGTIHLSFEHNF